MLPPFPMLLFEKKHQNFLCSLKIRDATKIYARRYKKVKSAFTDCTLFWCNYPSADFTFLVFCISLHRFSFASQSLHEHWTSIHSYFCYNFRAHLDVFFFFSNGSRGVWRRGGSTGYVLGDLVLKAQPKTRIPIIVSETVCKLCIFRDWKILCKCHISSDFCWCLEDNAFFLFLF